MSAAFGGLSRLITQELRKVCFVCFQEGGVKAQAIRHLAKSNVLSEEGLPFDPRWLRLTGIIAEVLY